MRWQIMARIGVLAGILGVPSLQALAGIRYWVTEIPGYNGQPFNAIDISETGIVLGKAVVPGQGFQILLWTPQGFASIGRPQGTTDMNAFHINKHGAIAGSVTIAGKRRAFRYIPFQGFQLPENPFGAPTEARGINAAGVMCGSGPGFVSYSNGWTDVVPLEDHLFANLYDMNDSLWSVGASYLTNHADAAVACRWYDTIPFKIGTISGYPASTAVAINAHGQVVGWGFTYNGLYTQAEAFYWSPEKGIVRLGTIPPYSYTQANDINLHSSIVGVAYNWPSPQKAFVKHPGWPLTLLNDVLVPESQGWDLLNAFAINDGGVIVGLGFRNGAYRPYMATPIYGDLSFGIGGGGEGIGK